MREEKYSERFAYIKISAEVKIGASFLILWADVREVVWRSGGTGSISASVWSVWPPFSPPGGSWASSFTGWDTGGFTAPTPQPLSRRLRLSSLDTVPANDLYGPGLREDSGDLYFRAAGPLCPHGCKRISHLEQGNDQSLAWQWQIVWRPDMGDMSCKILWCQPSS